MDGGPSIGDRRRLLDNPCQMTRAHGNRREITAYELCTWEPGRPRAGNKLGSWKAPLGNMARSGLTKNLGFVIRIARSLGSLWMAARPVIVADALREDRYSRIDVLKMHDQTQNFKLL
jgi:hypothetical protein